MGKKTKKKMNKGSVYKENLDLYFAINSESFKKDFLPVYQNIGIRPKYLIQFPILLPFYVPLKNGTCFTFALEDNNACTYHFSDVSTTENLSAGIVSTSSIKVPIKKSRVEMTFVTSLEINFREKEEILTDIFDSLLEMLNSILLSYQIYKKDVNAHRISKEMLEFGCIWRFVNVEYWSKAVEGLFLMHGRVAFIEEVLSEEDHNQIVWYVNVINKELNPFILSEELMLTAEQNFKNGFYKEVALFTQSSVETFLNTLFSLLLRYEGRTDIEIENIIEDIPFIKIVKRELPERLGGNWNPDVITGDVGKWYLYCYKLRNKVAHGGYSPLFSEVNESLYYARNMRKFVLDLIRLNKKKFPDILKYFEPSNKG